MKQTIGEFLATLRRANGFTQQEVADKLGISNRTLSAWERGTAMPDILLLPAIADLYGVTVDEILRGERVRRENPQLSDRSERNIYKSKYARFTTVAYILAGAACLGLVLFYIGLLTEITTVVWSGLQWWLLLLYAGLIIASISFVALFAVWRGAENGAAEDEGAHPYLISLSRSVSACALVSAVLCLLLMLLSLLLFFANPHSDIALSALPFGVIAFGLLLFCTAVRRRMIKRWCGESVREDLKKNRRNIKKCLAVCLIVSCLAVAALIVFAVWHPVSEITVYKNGDADSFRYKMESGILSYDGSIRAYNLSAASISGGVVELEDGVIASFSPDKSVCTLSFYEGDGVALVYEANRISDADGHFFVYNLRYSGTTMYADNQAYVGSILRPYLSGYSFNEIFSNDYFPVVAPACTVVICAAISVFVVFAYLSQSKLIKKYL